MPLKRGFSDPNFEAGGESEYDRAFRQACYRHCQCCHYPDCPQDCSGRQKAAAELEAQKHKETVNDSRSIRKQSMTNEDDDEEALSGALSAMLSLLPDNEDKASQTLAYLMAGWMIANVRRREHLMFLIKFNADVLECVQQVMEALEKDVGRERDRV